MANFKPTLKDPMSPQSEKFEKNFKKTMITTAPDVNLNEVDNMLNEKEQSLKKKIFSLAKMESLVFSDPKLSAVYEDMAENGEEKYGYHYNETIMNMIFNDYVLNSPKYLQKYKMSIPKEKKRRDKSGINQLKKQGEKKMTQSGLPKLQKTDVSEGNEPLTKVMFLVNERNPEDLDLFAYFPEEIHNGEYRTGYSHIGQHSAVHPDYAAESREATPEEYQDLKAELEGIGYNLDVLNGMNETTSAGSAGGAAGYVGYAGPAAWSKKGDLSGDFKKKKQIDPKAKPISRVISITETNYLTDPSGFEKYIQKLNEEADTEFIPKHSQAYGTVDNMSPENRNIIRTDIEKGKLNNNSNIKGGIALQEDESNFEQAKAEALRISKEEGVAQHVNQVSDNVFKVSDWYDADSTVISFENGRQLNELNLDEKSKSKSQQRFMGMVHAVQKGELSPDEVGGDVEKAAASMSKKDAEDFAQTKHKGLPEKLDEFLSLHDTVEYVSDMRDENPFEMHGDRWQFVWAKYPDGKKDIGVYRFGQDVVYDYARWQEEMGINKNMNEGTKDNLIDFDIPTWAAPALINADESGLSDEDQQKLNAFVDRVVKQYGNANFMLGDIDGEDNLGFRPTNDIDNLGSDVYRLYINPTREQNIMTENLDARYGSDETYRFAVKSKYIIGFQGREDILYFKTEEDALEYVSQKPETREYLGDNYIKEDMQTMIQNNGTSMSNKAQATGDQSSGVPAGMQATGGLNESDMKLLEEINKELEAFSIHHNKLKVMAEDRKPSALVLRDRVGSENEKNFKSDLQNSGTKEVIDVEKELMWKDQQTDVPNDPQKLGQDIEKQAIKTADMKGDEALKNVGDSTNDSGDEIPKRNLTTAEQEEVNLYRQGLHSPVFDNEPSKRFEDRMKADMGDDIYDQRQKQIAFKGQAPMYNKDPQPIEDTTSDKVQFNKDQTGWNERVGIDNEKVLKESMITGRYIDVLGKRRLTEFRLSEVQNIEKINENLMKLSFDGLGNTYMSKTVDKKVVVNEAVTNAMNSYQFYTDGKAVFSVKNPVQKLNENELKNEKPVVNEQVDKMKHLLGYKPKDFVNTSNVKKNRGF